MIHVATIVGDDWPAARHAARHAATALTRIDSAGSCLRDVRGPTEGAGLHETGARPAALDAADDADVIAV